MSVFVKHKHSNPKISPLFRWFWQLWVVFLIAKGPSSHLLAKFLYARLQTGRSMVWWCLPVRPSWSPPVSHSFPHFSPTCFEILILNFVCHFLLMNIRSSSNFVNFRQVLLEICPFLNFESWKYTVFRNFLQHALHIKLKLCICLCYTVLQIKSECRQFASMFVGVMPYLERWILEILEIHSSPHFYPACFDILSWNFAYDLVILSYRSSSNAVNFCWSFASFELQIIAYMQFFAL